MKPLMLLIAALLIVFPVIGAQTSGPGENIALAKTYTLNPTPNYSYCTDPGDTGQLTDGRYTGGYFWTQMSTVGWTNARPAIVTIDLGQVQPIRGVSYSTAAGVAGVEWPLAITLFVSDGGKTFYKAGDLISLSAVGGSPSAQGYASYRFMTDRLKTHGRYISFVVAPGGPYAFVDSPWATGAVLPAGRYDAEGNMIAEPDISHFNRWLSRWPEARQYCVFAGVGDRFDGSPMGTPVFARFVKMK